MSNVTIWHNPRCSKSRATLKLLQENGVTPEIRLYQSDGPSPQELRAVLAALGQSAASIMRIGDPLFKDLGLAKDMKDEALIAAMVAHPALIERPIVLKDSRVALGRPPENVLQML